jgi:hypothetical protein
MSMNLFLKLYHFKGKPYATLHNTDMISIKEKFEVTTDYPVKYLGFELTTWVQFPIHTGNFLYADASVPR